MSRIYTVHTRQFGALSKAADSIADAREWARTAFPGEACSVTPEHAHAYRASCDCAACTTTRIDRSFARRYPQNGSRR